MNKIESYKNIIEQLQGSIDELKKLPKTKKRSAYISELESRIAYREDKILEMEIEERVEETQDE